MIVARNIALTLLATALAGCSNILSAAPTATNTPAPSSTPSLTPSPTLTPTVTPLGCLTESGHLQRGEIPDSKPVQEFIVYLPRCYEQQTDQRYPVLYLLHGQTYKDDQWVNLGAPAAADALIRSGQAPPFIMVFPDDRYWNLPPGAAFGDRFVSEIVPFVDQNYRTLPDRDHRLVGGLSRGGGWAIHFLLTRYDLFGTVGLHSPVIFQDDAVVLQKLVAAVPEKGWPRLWLDAGDRDGELGKIRMFESLLTYFDVPHEWHLYAGDHTNPYWQGHVLQYLQWYAEAFTPQPADAAEPTPTP
jgi:enterochelin esterase-like enzyme